jgi:hypothetical protein
MLQFWNLFGEAEDKLEQKKKCTYNVTLNRVHGTTVTVEKQYYLLVCACVRVCAGVCVGTRARAHELTWMYTCLPPCKAYAPYCDVIFGPSVSTTFVDIIS